jgi:hypothetical protein
MTTVTITDAPLTIEDSLAHGARAELARVRTKVADGRAMVDRALAATVCLACAQT